MDAVDQGHQAANPEKGKISAISESEAADGGGSRNITDGLLLEGLQPASLETETCRLPGLTCCDSLIAMRTVDYSRETYFVTPRAERWLSQTALSSIGSVRFRFSFASNSKT